MQRFLTGRAQPDRHLLVVLCPLSEVRQKLVNFGQSVCGQSGTQPLRPPGGQIKKTGQEDYGDPSCRHAVPQQFAPGTLLEFRIDHVVLEGETHGEGETDDQAFSVVQPVLNEDLHAEDKQEGDGYREVGSHDRSRQRQDRGNRLRQERQRDKQDADAYPNGPGSDTGQFGHRNTVAVRCIGNRPAEAGQEVAETVRVDGPLDRSEIDGSRPTPRGALNRDSIAQRVHGPDQGNDQESRKQGPERGIEAQVEARIGAEFGEADPRSVNHTTDVIETKRDPNEASCNDADGRGPDAQGARKSQCNQDDGSQSHECGDRRGKLRGAIRNVRELPEDDRRDGYRDQHEHRAGHGRREDPPQHGHLRTEKELHE